MKAVKFRVQNYRNIDDSGWILLEKVTAFVGRNESGKTALLKALHKFNPGTPEPYDPLREFPRDRYASDFVAKGSRGQDWPVCSVSFVIPEELKHKIAALMQCDSEPPLHVTVTRYYSGPLSFQYDPPVKDKPLGPKSILNALEQFASSARRLSIQDGNSEETIALLRKDLANWATGWKDSLKDVSDLRDTKGRRMLSRLRADVESKSQPLTADMVEALLEATESTQAAARRPRFTEQIKSLIISNLPVLIYFENYGILDSAIWLPRFLEDLDYEKHNPRVRTINAMFRHVGIDAEDIAMLGTEEAKEVGHRNKEPTSDQIAADQRRKEERAIKLNSASIFISNRFSEWWSQRRHKIRYQADGDYFRIWVADDRRPDVEIELEARSKGFQWFFSFYLIFLVESDDGHKDAILLLDEPGLHLHPTAQQELILFFETLSKSNQIAYSTHSPFLIDGEHLHRVRPVTEDDSGHSQITAETWPDDRETIFPLMAAAGYAMIRGLFQHHKNLLVEGMTDYYYLHALSQQCARENRTALSDDIHITPCGGTKHVGYLASLFLGHKVRPIILLDGDDAGRGRQKGLLNKQYVGYDSRVLMLDEVLDRSGQEVEVEDILGEDILFEGLRHVLDSVPQLNAADRAAGSLPSQLEAAAKRMSLTLPIGWKASVALHLVSSWAENGTILSDDILDNAALLFSKLNSAYLNESSKG